MKIGIIGAGAMGCLYACLLSEKNNVTLFDVSQNVVNAINADGIVCGTPDGKEKTFHVAAALSGSAKSPFDLVILFVKDMVSEAALAGNRALIGSETTLLSLQNGMGNLEIMEK